MLGALQAELRGEEVAEQRDAVREVAAGRREQLQRRAGGVARQDRLERAGLDGVDDVEGGDERDAEPGARRLDQEGEVIAGDRTVDLDGLDAARAGELPGGGRAGDEDRVVAREVGEPARAAARREVRRRREQLRGGRADPPADQRRVGEPADRDAEVRVLADLGERAR